MSTTARDFYTAADLKADPKYLYAAETLLQAAAGAVARHKGEGHKVDDLHAMNTAADLVANLLGLDRGKLVAASKMLIDLVKKGATLSEALQLAVA